MVQREQRKRKVSSRLNSLSRRGGGGGDPGDTNTGPRDAWLETLENDNQAMEAEAELLCDEDDGAYVVGDEIVTTTTTRRKKKRAVERKRGGIERWNMSLTRMLLEEEDRPKGMPSLKDIEAGPSLKPPRKFCAVCGHTAPYTCSKCAARFCTLRCGDVHEQTQCLKMMAAI